MKTLLNLKVWAMMLVAVLMFSACGGDDPEPEPEPEPQIVEDIPGSIAGLGETTGDLTGTPYQLPQGIELAAKIWGGYNAANYARASAFDKTMIPENYFEQFETKTILTRAGETIAQDTIMGSGTWVHLLIPFKNITSSPIIITLPAGLIAKSVSGICQNGVLLKKVTIRIPANSICGVYLYMYCGNSHRDPSYSYEEYVFSVISNSSLIVDLCNRLKNKRINIEEYPDDKTQYNSYKSKLQSILWDLTDYGDEISADNIAYIEAMENI